MKVLQINFRDTGGGSTNCAVALTDALNEAGIYTTLGVFEKKSANPHVKIIPAKKNIRIPLLTSLFQKVFNKLALPFRHFTKFSTTNLIVHETNFRSRIDVNWINNSDYDIVHLHSLNGDLISIKDISKISKPIVWTLHDSWPCCGAEHHPNLIENDLRWQEGYTRKNKPLTTKGTDICRKVYLQKRKYLTKKNITFIAPSTWEQWICKTSNLFCTNKCEFIPNFINNSIFCKKNAEHIKNLFNIPTNKKILGFGANYGVDSPNSPKGSYYLIEALKKLPNKDDFYLVIFGPSSELFTKHISISFFETGPIYNKEILSCIYNLCDCFINPSLAESFGLTTLEAISCGIPCVAFNSTGTTDIIEHKKNGYLAEPYNIEDIVTGILFCTDNKALLSEYCIKKANEAFNKDKIVEQHIKLYKSLISNSNIQDM